MPDMTYGPLPLKSRAPRLKSTPSWLLARAYALTFLYHGILAQGLRMMVRVSPTVTGGGVSSSTIAPSCLQPSQRACSVAQKESGKKVEQAYIQHRCIPSSLIFRFSMGNERPVSNPVLPTLTSAEEFEIEHHPSVHCSHPPPSRSLLEGVHGVLREGQVLHTLHSLSFKYGGQHEGKIQAAVPALALLFGKLIKIHRCRVPNRETDKNLSTRRHARHIRS